MSRRRRLKSIEAKSPQHDVGILSGDLAVNVHVHVEVKVRIGRIVEEEMTDGHLTRNFLILRVARRDAACAKALQLGPDFRKLVLDLIVDVVVVAFLPCFRAIERVGEDQLRNRSRILQRVALRDDAPYD
jgi:hypothetical protein